MDCGVPMPRNQERQVGNPESGQGNGSAIQNGNTNGGGGRDDAMYHLLPAFSPFDDDVPLPETRSEIAVKALGPPPGLGPRPETARPATSRAMFSPFFPSDGERNTRSLRPSTQTMTSAASIWSTETTTQQSPFAPSPAPLDTTSNTNAENRGYAGLGLVSPFAASRVEAKTPNMFSLQGLWDDSPVKQTSKTVQPSYRYGENESPSLFHNGHSAATLGGTVSATEGYPSSIMTQSTIGPSADDHPRFDPPSEHVAAAASRPGLPLVGSIAGIAGYTNDLLSIKEIEEKMSSLRMQSSGLAGELIQQAAKYVTLLSFGFGSFVRILGVPGANHFFNRIQTARLELEKQWAQAEREMGPQRVDVSGSEPRLESATVPVEAHASGDGSSVSHFRMKLVHQKRMSLILLYRFCRGCLVSFPFCWKDLPIWLVSSQVKCDIL